MNVLRLEKPSGMCVCNLSSFQKLRESSKESKQNFEEKLFFTAGCLGRHKILIFVQKADALSRGFETSLDVLGGWEVWLGKWETDSAEHLREPATTVWVGAQLISLSTSAPEAHDCPAVEPFFCYSVICTGTGQTLLFLRLGLN